MVWTIGVPVRNRAVSNSEALVSKKVSHSLCGQADSPPDPRLGPRTLGAAA